MDEQTQVEAPIDLPAPAPAAERLASISALVEGHAPSAFVPYGGLVQRMPVAEIPQALLLYRVENGRLIAELSEDARRRGRDIADLRTRQDTQDVQQLLHDFLVAKSRDPDGPVYQELARLAVQTEPLLVSAEGVLINGNRRLAAMRQLLHADPERYAGFATISAAVLPANAAAREVEATEAALQMAPETKLGYGWINRRLKMRRQRDDLGLSLETIANAYRIEDPAQIGREIGELDLAEDYLSHFTKTPGVYSGIADAEVLFAGLHERLIHLQGRMRRLWRLGGFTMIHGRAEVSGPMDRHFPFAPPVPEHLPGWTLRRFAEEREVAGEREEENDSDLPIDQVSADNLKPILSDASESDEVAPALFNLMERLRAEHQVERSPQRVLKLLQRVRTNIESAPVEVLTEQHLRKMRSELAAIQTYIGDLLGQEGAATAKAEEPKEAPAADGGDAHPGLAKRLARALKPG